MCSLYFIILFAFMQCHAASNHSDIRCMIASKDSCSSDTTTSESSYCCNYLEGKYTLTPQKSLSYMKQIRDIGISHIVLRIVVSLVAAVLLLLDSKSEQNVGFTGVSCFALIIVFFLSWSIVGIIDETNMMDFFDDLESNGCYVSDQAFNGYPLSWFASQSTSIFAAAVSVGILSIICFVIAVIVCFCVDGGEDIDVHALTICCHVILFIAEIVLWAYIFPTHRHWNDVYSSNMCYSLGTYSPTSHPTMDPTVFPTLYPTISPTPIPTLYTSTPTALPTLYPTSSPTAYPISNPTQHPTIEPTLYPTFDPTLSPTINPTVYPTSTPISTAHPTISPTPSPTPNPTIAPTIPTLSPTPSPTFSPTLMPTKTPTFPTKSPTNAPTNAPSFRPGTQNFYDVNASHSAPFFIVAAGTFIAFMINLYIFDNEQKREKKDTLTDSLLDDKQQQQHNTTTAQLTPIQYQSPTVNIKNKDKKDDGAKGDEVVQDDKDKEKEPKKDDQPKVDDVEDDNKQQQEQEQEEDKPKEEDNKDEEKNDDKHNTEKKNEVDGNKIILMEGNNKQSLVNKIRVFCCGGGCYRKLKDIAVKYRKLISVVIVIYQVISLFYTFGYSWVIASDSSPDHGQITWSNYQCFVKSFTISSHFKSEMTTLFVLLSKNILLQKSKQDYDTTIMVFLFFWLLLGVVYVISIFITHLLPGIFIFFPVTITGAVILAIVYYGLRYFTQSTDKGDENFQRDWIIWIGALICTVSVVACGVIIECMVIFWDKPSLWFDSIAIVVTERSFVLYFEAISDDIKTGLNFIAMIS